MIKVMDRMSPTFISLPKSSTALEVAKLLTDEGIGAIMIKNPGEEVSGIITEADLTRRVIAAEKDPATTIAEEIMSNSMICVDVEASLEEAGDLMDEKHVRHLGVTAGGKIVGIISVRDLLRPNPLTGGDR